MPSIIAIKIGDRGPNGNGHWNDGNIIQAFNRVTVGGVDYIQAGGGGPAVPPGKGWVQDFTAEEKKQFLFVNRSEDVSFWNQYIGRGKLNFPWTVGFNAQGVADLNDKTKVVEIDRVSPAINLPITPAMNGPFKTATNSLTNPPLAANDADGPP